MRSPPRPAAASARDSVEVLWVGHSTVLVRLGDRWILTDPVFSERIGGGLVRRYVRSGIDIEDLPPLDWVVVSHAHADHLFGTFWKRDAGELGAVQRAIDAHPRSRWIRLLDVGESTTFHW